MGGKIGLFSEEIHNRFSGFPCRGYAIGSGRVGVAERKMAIRVNPKSSLCRNPGLQMGIDSPVMGEGQGPVLT